jgi:hypothetical protein
MGDFFRQRIIDTDRLPLFCFFAAFIVTFLLTRVNVRRHEERIRRPLIRAEIWLQEFIAGHPTGPD